MHSDFRTILEALHAEGVGFVLVGGLAMVSHGSTFVTNDLDICYQRTPESMEALARVLRRVHARLRGAPEGLPFVPDARTLKAGMNFTFATDAGDFDVLGELAGVGGFREIAEHADTIDLYGHPTKVMGIDQLIVAKRAAGRPKDLLHAEELEEIRRRR